MASARAKSSVCFMSIYHPPLELRVQNTRTGSVPTCNFSWLCIVFCRGYTAGAPREAYFSSHLIIDSVFFRRHASFDSGVYTGRTNPRRVCDCDTEKTEAKLPIVLCMYVYAEGVRAPLWRKNTSVIRRRCRSTRNEVIIYSGRKPGTGLKFVDGPLSLSSCEARLFAEDRMCSE